MSFISPIETYDGYLIKRDDMFSLGEIIKGGKVRQCSKLVYDNLDHILVIYSNLSAQLNLFLIKEVVIIAPELINGL